MKIATWNVNSVRARLERMLSWLRTHRPDVLCLQELKTVESGFPFDAVRQLGYDAAVYGQKTYNGVAILSRHPMRDVRRGFDDGAEEDPQARLIGAEVADALRVISAYVPNGSHLGSEKYAYKLRWLQRLGGCLAIHHRPEDPLLLCGDFNVAPEDLDVCDPDGWRDSVLCHADARAALQGVTSFGLRDLFRHASPEERAFSWWDYRQLSFQKNTGLRIDMIYGTRPTVERLRSAIIDRDERKGNRPSDHAPVVVELG